MTHRPILAVLLLAIPAVPVLASSFAGSSAGASSAGSSASSGSTSGGDDKVVAQARDDAAGFVATDGALRTARLDAALRHLREHDAAQRAQSDLQLARAILAR